MTQKETLLSKLRRAGAGLCAEDPSDYFARGLSAQDAIDAADLITALLSEVERLRTRSERLAGALRFYASKNAWRSVTVYMCGHSGPSQAVLDSGKKALQALAQEGEG